MGLETFQAVIVVDLDDGILDCSVHPRGLAVRPWMVGLGQPMLDAVGDADPVEDVRAEEAASALSAIRRFG
ncbi:hypothetical protein FHX11_003459 [Rhizobium sp. BK602]|nr:hypothetical protein [Rhizobium sp. BK602]